VKTQFLAEIAEEAVSAEMAFAAKPLSVFGLACDRASGIEGRRWRQNLSAFSASSAVSARTL
jgi:hypothetical protein